MKKYIKMLFVFTVIIFHSCKEKSVQLTNEIKKVKVKIHVAEEKQYSERITGSGRIASEEEQKLSFKTGGIIKAIYVKEGEKVNKGDVLAELNLSEIQASVKQAKLGLEKAMRDFERIENLYKDSVATLEQYQNVKTALGFAKSNVEIATYNLNFSTIKAPGNGTVLKKLAEENEMIGSGHPVFLFGQNKSWIVKTNVTDKQVINLSIGDEAIVETDAYPGKKFKATILEIGSFADPYTGTFAVTLNLKETSLKLVSGLITNVELHTTLKDTLISIPYISLIEADKKEGVVMKVINGKPKKQIVKIDRILDKEIMINSGLKDGDTIITEGVNYVKPGQLIEIIE